MSTNLRTRASWTFGLPRSVHAFGVNLLLLPLGIATSIVIARTVGPTGKGSLDLIVATSALLTLLLSMSLPQGVTYVVAQRPSTASTLAAQLVFVSLLQATIALLVLGVLRLTPHFPRFLPDWGPWIIGGVVLFVWVDLVSKFWAAILTGQQHIAIVNNAEFVGRVTQFVSVFVIAAVLYFSGKQLSVAVLFGVTVSASALINILLLASLDFRFQLSRDWGGLKAAVAFAIPNYAANVVQFLNYRLDVFVVGFFAGTASVGRYTLAVSLGQLLWLMSNSVAAVLLPKVAAATERDVSVRHTARVTRLCLWATAFCALVLAALATQAMRVMSPGSRTNGANGRSIVGGPAKTTAGGPTAQGSAPRSHAAAASV